jgi:PKD repeat protein
MEGPAVSDRTSSELVQAVRGKISTWLKTLIGTLAGLLSGAFMMYLSPVLDKVVKPSKPVANFALDHQGTTVTFYNRSSGGSEGWWDFGDGSSLEPLVPKQESITHTYAAPGDYIAKLTLRNLLGEESERTVNVQLEGTHSDPPAILSLDAAPISTGAYAPATFRVVSQSKNAKLCVWDYGDDRNLEISTESPNNQDRYVVFRKAGGYMVKEAAVNGDQAVEKSTIVYVDEPPPGTIAAIVTIKDHGTRVEKEEDSVPVTAAFPPDVKDSVYQFDRQVPARSGFTITAARFEPINDRGARNLQLKVADDGHAAHFTGELVRDTTLFHRSDPPPTVLVRATLTQERHLADKRPAIPITGTLTVPGSVLLVLPQTPANWIDVRRELRLELHEGDRVAWPESQLPRAVALTLQNRRLLLSATPLGSQVRVELAEDRSAQQLSAK